MLPKGMSVKEGDTIMVAADTASGKVWFGLNGQWKSPSGGPASPGVSGHTALMDGYGPDKGEGAPPLYYPSAGYTVGKMWMLMKIGAAQKYVPPGGFTSIGPPPLAPIATS